MPVIGQFMRENDGFIGHLTTLSLHQDIIIVAAEPSDAENAPPSNRPISATRLSAFISASSAASAPSVSLRTCRSPPITSATSPLHGLAPPRIRPP